MIFDDLSLIKAEIADVAGSTAIENNGNNSLTFIITSPASSAAAITVSLKESNDGTTFTEVDSEQIIGNADFATTDTSTVKMIGYAGGAKYVKLYITGTTTGYTALAIKGRNRHL